MKITLYDYAHKYLSPPIRERFLFECHRVDREIPNPGETEKKLFNYSHPWELIGTGIGDLRMAVCGERYWKDVMESIYRKEREG
jgi:hypothetical protein